MLFCLLLLCGLVNGANKVSNFFNSDLLCTLNPSAMYVTQTATCTTAPCSNLVSKAGTNVTCPSTLTYPSGWVRIETWGASTTCSGVPDAILATPKDTCSGFWTGATVTLSCSTKQIFDCGASTQTCSGCTAKTADTSGNCVAGNPTTSFIVSSYKFICSTSFAILLVPGFLAVLAFLI